MTEDQHQQLIIAMVGDDAAGTLLTHMPTLWVARGNITDLALRALYVRRDAIDLMLGRVRGQVKIVGVGGASIDAGQLSANLQSMRTAVDQLIAEQRTAGGISFISVRYNTATVDEFGRPECL